MLTFFVGSPGGRHRLRVAMSRRHEAATLLAGFKGVLHADAYSDYAQVERQNDQLIPTAPGF
jgi:hypothetical protein